MGLFKEAVKFAGFAGKAEDALRFEHFSSAKTLTTTVFKGAETVGFITTDVGEKAAYVASSMVFTPRQGIGQTAYKEIARHLFETTGVRELTSDMAHSTSKEAQGMWGKLLKKGYAESVLYEKEGAIAEGWRITDQTLKAGETAGARFMEADTRLAQTIMEAGAGHDNSSLLKRSMRAPGGSRKMSGAL